MRKFGKAFPDELTKFSKKSGYFKHTIQDSNFSENLNLRYPLYQEDAKFSRLKLYLFLFIVTISFLGLIFRLFHLQVIEGTSSRELADSNRIQIKTIHAPRGVIYDRSGKILAQNEPGFRLIDTTGGNRVAYLNRDEALELEVSKDPKFKNLEIDNLRNYPEGEIFAHVLGYISEVTLDELSKDKSFKFKVGDRIGRAGVEQTYEEVFRGIDGGEVIEVDAQGKLSRILRQTPPISGQNLILSIDKDLQKITYENLRKVLVQTNSCCGVVVVQEVKTGEVLALVSYPVFDPKNVESSLSDLNSPFVNRAISGTYPPGSIFKIVSSAAGLISGKINSETLFLDTGEIFLGPYKFSNWYFTQYGKTEGLVNLVNALKRSNDIYFYRLGQTVGESFLKDAAGKFGLGKKTNIDLPGEVQGVVPDNEWKQKNIGDIWFPGDTLHMAIGQGFLLVTPLQVNSLISAIANGGVYFEPKIASKITSGDKTIKEFKPTPKKIPGLSKDNIQLIKKGLEQVTTFGGTAWPMFTFPIKTAGKTGTAEFGHPKNYTHAWYATYAPADDPEVAVTVLIEAGGEGSSVAAPVAKEILRWYFSPDKSNLIKDIYPLATESGQILKE